MIFVLKAAFHFGSFIYRSVSGMRPLSSVNNGSDNSKQFSFTLKFLSHCSIFVYFSDVFTFFLCLFIFSIREYSCNVSQTYLRVQKKNNCCIIFYCIFTLGNDVFLHFSQKNSKIFGGFALDPLGDSQHPPDHQLMFYVPSARSFFASQNANAPIFFLYYPWQHRLTLIVQLGKFDQFLSKAQMIHMLYFPTIKSTNRSHNVAFSGMSRTFWSRDNTAWLLLSLQGWAIWIDQYCPLR